MRGQAREVRTNNGHQPQSMDHSLLEVSGTSYVKGKEKRKRKGKEGKGGATAYIIKPQEFF